MSGESDPRKTFLEVQPERIFFGLYRISIVLRERSIWLSDDAWGWPADRFQNLSVAKARAKARWAHLNPYWIVMLFGNRRQRCWRRVYERRESL
jgi:hypothetical protein